MAASSRSSADLFRADRNERREGKKRGELRHLQGSSASTCRHAIDLVDRGDHAASPGREVEHAAIGVVELPRFEDRHDRVDAGEAVAHRAVHALVQARAMPGLEPRRVDEDELRIGGGQDAGDPVARRLRLFRGDADSCAYQRIEQRRLADVGTPDDRHLTAAKRRPRRSAATLSVPAADENGVGLRGGRLLRGAAARPAAGGDDSSAGMRHSTVNDLRMRFARDVDDHVFRHRDAPRLQPLLQPRLRVLAERRRIKADELIGEDRDDDTARAASKPPSRKIAPNMASSVSARIDGLLAPPLFSSPFAEAAARHPDRAIARAAPTCRD